MDQYLIDAALEEILELPHDQLITNDPMGKVPRILSLNRLAQVRLLLMFWYLTSYYIFRRAVSRTLLVQPRKEFNSNRLILKLGYS
jgi:hypothetical protein